MKHLAVVTAYNEGVEVERTVQSLVDSAGANINQTVLLVDDASTDGSCSGISDPMVDVIRNDAPLGLGRSRNLAMGYPFETVSWHDAHMRFPDGVIEACAKKALEGRCIVTASSRGFTETDFQGARKGQSGFQGWGCNLYWNRMDCFQAKWKAYGQKEEWARTPTMMGACYVMSRETAEYLASVTGQVWEDTAGRWGFSEQALAIKAFLMDVPVLSSRDLITRHLYRDKNPLNDTPTPPAGESWKNITRSCAVLFSPANFAVRIMPYIVDHIGIEAIQEVLGSIPKVNRTWTPDDEEKVFTHLCGKDALITERHPDLAYLDELDAAIETLSEDPKVLFWRAGEGIFHVRRKRPKASIFCIETEGHRTENWLGLSRPLNVKLASIQVHDDRYVAWAKSEAMYDMVVVGGERQKDCQAILPELTGGTVIVDATMGRRMVEDGVRNKEEGAAKEVLSPKKKEDAQVTVLLLNYRRPENIGPILDSLARQTVPVRVIVWNNGDPLMFTSNDGKLTPIANHPLVDLVVTPSENRACWPRWLMASLASTKYVCSMDDDLVFADSKVIADCINVYEEKALNCVIGFFGWIHVDGKGYQVSKHVNGSRGSDVPVDLVKGRFMFMKRSLLTKVPMVPVVLDPDIPDEDDIYVCTSIAEGRRQFHIVPGKIGRRWKELPQRHTSRASRPGHYKTRGQVAKKLFAHYGTELK